MEVAYLDGAAEGLPPEKALSHPAIPVKVIRFSHTHEVELVGRLSTMPSDYLTGTALVLAAGLFQGTFMLPMKFRRQWAWENTWLVFACTAYLIFPWLLVLLTLPHFGDVLLATSNRSLLLVEAYGVAWGVGTVTYGLGVDLLGLGLGLAIINGLAATAGTLIPMIVLSPAVLNQRQGRLTILSLLVVLIGIAICSWSGKLRDASRPPTEGRPARSYRFGLLICIASGLLAACGNLGFAFGNEVVEKAIAHGATKAMAGNSVWALITLPLFLSNGVYCTWLFRKNGTGKLFLRANTQYQWILGTLMGILWIAGFACYSPGTRQLGSLGTSIGWSIMLSTIVITANFWGLLTGEWTNAGRKAHLCLLSGVAVLTLAICIVGYANYQ